MSVEPPPDDGDAGIYVGMEYANIHPWIGNACSKPDGVDHVLLARFYDDLSLDDLFRSLEVDAVHRSWAIARQANREATQP